MIDKKSGESVKNEILLERLNHIFTEILPKHGYAVRENQIKLAEHILNVINHRGISLAESEVGTGKTHAYIIAAALAKRGRLNDLWIRSLYPRKWAESAHMPVVISTSSIALQNAIVTDYIPELSRILMEHGIIRTPLTAVVRKGKEHYICEHRLLRFFNNADIATKTALAPFTGATAPFDLTNADKLSKYMKRNICVSGRCGDTCKFAVNCRYNKHLKVLNDTTIDFQITNHNYFLADTLHRANGKRPLLPNYRLVIVDEAHKFLSATRTMYGIELTNDEIPDLMREVHTFINGKSKSGANVHRLAKKLETQSDKLFQRLKDNIPDNHFDDDSERFLAVIDKIVLHHLNNITDISTNLADAIEDSNVAKLYGERRDKAVWRLDSLDDKVRALSNCGELIHWFEKDATTKTTELNAIPKNLNQRLHRDLWSKGIPVILTSGTLSAAGDFTRTKETLGLDRMPSHKLFDTSMPSPFDFKNNAMLYISENMPFPCNSDRNYITAIADEIENLVRASNGHAAALFTSYNVMGQVHAILQDRNLPFPLFRLERGGTRAIEQFKQSGNGILFASGALWEGIDIPGDTLSMLIIVKLPFAVPDPIGDYERLQCGSMELYKSRAVVPDMLVKLKQGFGRLIRNETDTGVCAILDSRANMRGNYRNRVLAALPDCEVTSDILNVKRFFNDKKSPEYFR